MCSGVAVFQSSAMAVYVYQCSICLVEKFLLPKLSSRVAVYPCSSCVAEKLLPVLKLFSRVAVYPGSRCVAE